VVSAVAPPSGEYVAPAKRKPLSDKQRAQRFLQAEGRCEKCGGRIRNGEFEVDHDTSLYSGGKESPDNRYVLCWPCHGTKTAKRDAPAHAKIDRIHKRRAGIKSKSRLTHPKLKRRFDGSVVERS
jgi:5-methylcytosine-specific restriction endonuclease McrA